MLILNNLMMPPETDFQNLNKTVATILAIDPNEILSAELHKKAVDARRKGDVHFCCSVKLELKDEANALEIYKKYSPSVYKETPYVFLKSETKLKNRPVIVGFGPAGMFCALTLAEAGLCPLVLEQGADSDSRKKAVDSFFSGGKLDPSTNVQFGEGGAGTFSDGKLNSGIKSPLCREILQIFVRFGANENILYDSKPHIGTDVLVNVVKNLRNHIISLGGEVRFLNKVTNISAESNGVCASVHSFLGEYEIYTEHLVLAPGHSARDTFKMLHKNGLCISQKPFAIGARIEHLQGEINKGQYGPFYDNKTLGAADYKLALHLPKSGRGVYTFCMCPGGFVVNASSEQGGVVTNGMSYNLRHGMNANSALLVSVEPSDFDEGNPLDGMLFQEKIEQKAFALTNSFRAVSQTVGDFMRNVPSKTYGIVKPTVRPAPINATLDEILPAFVTDAMREALPLFGQKLRGFNTPSALLTGPETRSSSPVRIDRSEDFLSNISGLYPCGEGSGYAGGIMSSAVDGMRTAEAIIKSIK